MVTYMEISFNMISFFYISRLIFQERILAEPDFTEVAQLLSKLPETISADLLFQHIQVVQANCFLSIKLSLVTWTP